MSVTTSTKSWEKCSRAQLLEAVHALIDQRDKALRRIAELEPAVDRVRRLHSQDEGLLAPGKWCQHCGHEEPCPTLRALRGRAS